TASVAVIVLGRTQRRSATSHETAVDLRSKISALLNGISGRSSAAAGLSSNVDCSDKSAGLNSGSRYTALTIGQDPLNPIERLSVRPPPNSTSADCSTGPSGGWSTCRYNNLMPCSLNASTKPIFSGVLTVRV